MLSETVPPSTSRNGRCGKPRPHGGTFDGSSEPYSACLSPVHQARARAAHCGPAPGSWLPQRIHGLTASTNISITGSESGAIRFSFALSGKSLPIFDLFRSGGTRAVPPDGFPECLKEHG